MSYLHCHACEWEQDDFRTRSYNFRRYMLGRGGFAWSFIEPRFWEFDPPCRTRFSWVVLWIEILRWIRRTWHMKWRTNRAWKSAIAKNGGKWPACPQCHQRRLDID